MARKPQKPDADGESEGEASSSGGKGLKGLVRSKLALAGVAVLLLAGGGAFGAMKMGLVGGHGDGEERAEAASETRGRGEKIAVSFVDLPEMMVNLDSKDRPQYLKVKIALEVGEEKLAADIQPMMPRVLDTFQTYMRQLRPSDLEGSAGLFRLKEELTRRVNVAVYPAKVDAVLFKEIVVQ